MYLTRCERPDLSAQFVEVSVGNFGPVELLGQ